MAQVARLSSGTARVVLYGRTGCHLCDIARGMLAQVCAETATSWREIDIDADDEARARYADLIPVVEVDGRRIGFWRIEKIEVERALRQG